MLFGSNMFLILRIKSNSVFEKTISVSVKFHHVVDDIR